MEYALIVLGSLLALGLAVVVWLLVGLKRSSADAVRDIEARLLPLNERLERELRSELGASASHTRTELGQLLNHGFANFSQSLSAQSSDAATLQAQRIDALTAKLDALQKTMGDTLATQIQALSQANAMRLSEVRAALDQQLAQLQASNQAKLEEMRKTVDEKLQATLETRLTASFAQVAQRLEQVHKGLGEMQSLAAGVGDLKHLLTNVKTRGMFGEAQLGALLEQVFAPEQYAAQVSTKAGSREAVDYAIRLPGKGEADSVMWLPIDAKFPSEDYERLLQAQERADKAAADQAAAELERRIRLEAKSIRDKYIDPPATTDFAILFLPSEGLYAEVLRRPGLVEALQRDHRVALAGPTTLLAILNSLQMGFRTLALEKRSSEVREVLGAVKKEFEKFGDTLNRVQAQTKTVLTTLEATQVRTRAMTRALKSVEALPDDRSQSLLQLSDDEEAQG